MKPAPVQEKKEASKVPLPYFITLIIILIGLIIWHFYTLKTLQAEDNISIKTSEGLNVEVIRNKDYKLVRPLILVDQSKESQELLPLKEEIQVIIDNKKQTNEIQSASVYVRKLNKGDWISINGNERFHTGSLMKVPVMVYYLKQAEINPAILEQKITFTKPEFHIPNQTFTSKSIVIGKQYTVLELIKFMIRYSDNYATYLLNKNLDKGLLAKIFRDLQLQVPEVMSMENQLTPMEFSRFMRVLYNGSYLSPHLSQLALEILSESDFAIGIRRNLPNDLVVAHKFGEASFGEKRTFSESGIVYDQDEPYLLTIMATGSNDNQIIDFIGDVSGFIFNKIRIR